MRQFAHSACRTLLLFPILSLCGFATAQMAPPLVYNGTETVEQAALRQRAAFHSVRGIEGPIAGLQPLQLDLTKQDWAFLDSTCPDCDGAQLIPAGVTKTPDQFINFNHLDLAALENGTTDFAGGVAGLDADGTVWWNMALESPGSEGLRLHLRDLTLPPGSELLLYSLNGEAHGPYSADDITKSGSLWTLTVSDSLAYFEVRYPLATEAPSLRLWEVGVMVDTPRVSQATAGEKATSCGFNQCHEEYACADLAEFPNLPTISNAVARIRFQKDAGFYLCSGGLVNDGRGLEKMLFVTANHCFDSQASAESVEFRWRYRSETCLAGCLPTSAGILTTGGGDLIATSTNTDFTMIELTNPPPAGSVFLGWDAQTNYQNTAGIDLYRVHHPSGEMQHVTKYWTNTANTTCTARPRSRYIQMTRNIGFTTGGSSGSLIVNNKAQMVGQFYGGCGAAAVGNCDPNRIHVDGAFRISFPLVEEHLTPIPETEAVYTFNVASGAWNTPASWTPPRNAPLSTDILLFDGTSPSGNTVTVSSIPTETIGRLMVINGAQVVLQNGLSATTTLNISTEGESFSVESGCSLELNNGSAGMIRIVLQPAVTGTVEGDIIFAAQDDGANPRIVSRSTGALVFESGSSAAAAPGVAAATESSIIQRGGFGSATDGAVNGGVVFRPGATWYQGGRKDGTRAGAESGGPHGLNSPSQAVQFERGSTYVVLRGGLATPRNYPTVIFRDDTGVRNVAHGAVIDGDLVMAEPGGNAAGVGSLNINALLEPAITILGDVIVPAGAGIPSIVGTATPGVVSRAYLSGDVLVGDPAKFPAGLNGRRWHFNGTTPQTVDFSAEKTLHRIAVENLSGVTFADSVTLTGGLELISGPLNVGAGTLFLGAVVVSTPVNGWIIGGAQRTLDPANTSTTRIFHVGTADGPGWVRVTPLVAAGTAGELHVRSTPGAHSEAAALGAPFGRWWNLSAAEGLNAAGGSFRISFDWQESDVPPNTFPHLVQLVRFHNSTLEVHGAPALTVDLETRRATLEGATDFEGDWFLISQEPMGTETWRLY